MGVSPRKRKREGGGRLKIGSWIRTKPRAKHTNRRIAIMDARSECVLYKYDIGLRGTPMARRGHVTPSKDSRT